MEEPKRKIVINGKTYESPEDMPPELRQLYERAMNMLGDADANGVPDVLEGKGPGIWQMTKEIWSLGRDARSAGIHSVDFPDGIAGMKPRAPDVPTASSSSSPTPADRWSTEVRTVTSTTANLPPGPTEVGGSNLRKLVLAIAVATAFAFALQSLGWIE